MSTPVARLDAFQPGRGIDLQHQRAARGSGSGRRRPRPAPGPRRRGSRPAVRPPSARTGLALPPRCRLERKSPFGACRRIVATTSPPTTKQRRSAPLASAMNSCTRKLAYSPRKASITLREADGFSVSITPAPCVPSLSLITCGGGPSIDSRSIGVVGVVAEHRDRQADPLRRQQLVAAQLVARARDRVRRVGRVGAHQLELAQHRRAIARDRGADARDHRGVAGDRPCPCSACGSRRS